MIAYQLDENGFYLYETKASRDPLASKEEGKDVWVLPRGCTFVTPPVIKEYHARRFIDNEWIYVPDYRGCFVYQMEDRMLIESMGAIPEGWSLQITPEYLDMEERELWKVRRDKNIELLTVSVDGFIFDADKDSVNNMNQMIQSCLFLQKDTVDYWRMADNEEVFNLPLKTLRIAHAKAVQEISKLMVRPQ